MNTKTIIATAQATDTIALRITADAYGWYVTHIFTDGSEIWDCKSYNSEAKARAAANGEWTRLRNAERAA